MSMASKCSEYLSERIGALEQEIKDAPATSKGLIMVCKIQVDELKQVQNVLSGGQSIYQGGVNDDL